MHMKKYFPVVMIALVLGVIFGTIFVAVQQVERANANWPQIQQAEDGAVLLNKNQPPRIFSGTYVDLSKSLATFTNVYDLDGKPVTGEGYLNGSLATVPKGVLTAADDSDYHTVTWEPKSGVRLASVVVRSNKYYVLSGRSLQEVEKNASRTLVLTLVGYLLCLAIATTYYAVITPEITLPKLKKLARKKQKEE